ncbi:DUF3015 family protein [Leptospira perdikensis]|uniref:DUF3015 domain-containing protein n=1 Tax=Leptospira perdikensis TaxID=2484948 RepID=A0A4R9JIS8_9LEPT|nr:DUF3015 family protein [Leptospira perdikensis]TGL44843.1 DUF3015 domain-containing protein [Leptospira perdikensis]
MKKLTLISTIGISMVLLASQMSAAPKYGMAGCGLGTLVMPTGNQVFVATTNGTSGSQTFGITTGTSNCKADGVAQKEHAREIYVHMNFDGLEQEMAAGKGEKLSNLATLFECKSGVRFNEVVKENYSRIFTEESKANPSLMLSNLHETLEKDQTVKNYCKI